MDLASPHGLLQNGSRCEWGGPVWVAQSPSGRFGCTTVARHRKPLILGPDGFPEFLRWHIVIEWKALLCGALLTVGGTLLLQQLGATTLSVSSLLWSLVLGLALGIAAPSLGRLVGVVWANSLLRRARKEQNP